MTHLNIEFSSTPSVTEQAAQSATHIAELINANAYQFFHVLKDTDLHNLVATTATSLKSKFVNFVVLGTGGSSLGGKTLCALTDNPFKTAKHPLYFIDNVDPRTITQLLTSLNLQETCFIAISKSGTTAETMMQTLCVMAALEQQGLEAKDHFVIITEAKDSPMTRLATAYHLPTLEHDMKIGGRFSVFSIVGLLPAALGGVNIKALTQAALDYLAEFHQHPTHHPATLGAQALYQAMESDKPMTVMMPYVDALNCFAAWYAQLWAESLGKQGRGSTPVKALGTVDQHSQLQLYYDGPKDKYFTFLIEETAGQGSLPLAAYHDQALTYLAGRTMGDLMAAEAQATVDSLKNAGCPLRCMRFNGLDEAVMGELLVHFMLETILTAEMMGVDAFNQPGVEDSKVRTKDYLQIRHPS
jgi:Glucose-6-phosphate isomerase